MSTAFCPQTDGQTEHINQIIASYHRSYCNYEQNDWASNLAVAEYPYNHSKYSAMKISPVHAKYGFEPRLNWPPEIQLNNPASDLYAHYLTSINPKLSKQLEVSSEAMK